MKWRNENTKKALMPIKRGIVLIRYILPFLNIKISNSYFLPGEEIHKYLMYLK